MNKIILIFLVAVTTSTAVVAQESKKNITLEDIFVNRTFQAKGVGSIQSMKDGKHYTTLDNGALVRYSFATGKVVDTLVKNCEWKRDDIKLQNYAFSSDEQKILFYVNAQPIYRHSFVADYYVWDLKNKTLHKISNEGSIQLATFSPDGTHVAFVKDNNLYISNLKGEVKAITTDGEKNKIINGAPDWVYEEEFSFHQAYQWSPDGKRLAWIRFDESHVKEYNLMVYKGLNPEIKENFLYPAVYSYKYPKAGEDNSVVSVHCYSLETEEISTMDIGTDPDIYIPRIYWVPDAKTLAIVRLNRHQNKMELLFADSKKGISRVVYTDKNPRYIDEPAYANLTFINNYQIIIFNEKDGYNHIYVHNILSGKTTPVTTGGYDVINLLGFDLKKNLVFYTSTEEGAIYRTVYSITLDGKKKQKISTRKGSNNAWFNSDYTYYIHSYSSANEPPIITLHSSNGKLIRTLENNHELRTTLTEYLIPTKEFFSFTTEENIPLNAWILKPVNFNPEQKYPVLITQYSGPNSQQVLDRWGIGWEHVLTEEGFIVVCVDPRGTGGRGEEFRKVTYLQLGKYETIDLINTAKYLGKLSFIDSSRIAIWGWSYGGFMALNCITQGADVFAAAISVSPVTNWRYYDNIYTERFMRKPQENPDGYDNNSPINHVNKYKGKLLIVTGTFDDNVHPQNTYEFSEAMVQADKQFDMMVYVNRNHSIFGGNTRMHLYTKKINFLKQNLK